ncbi:MAG: TfoX/Sxy family protein [Flavobacteriales bacterium]|nr:TfoX/Sxy family protein [Flavobacteriales bacterium]
MGIKGDKMTQGSVLSAEILLEKLVGLGDITSKKMFGGHGIFHEGKMFGIIDSKGKGFMKADEEMKEEMVNMGAEQHSRMPYYSISDAIFKDQNKLKALAKRSIDLSK